MILLILTKDLFHVYVDNYHVILQISLNQNLPISVEYEVRMTKSIFLIPKFKSVQKLFLINIHENEMIDKEN